MTRQTRLLLVPAICMTTALLTGGCKTDPIKAPGAGRADLLRFEDYPQIAATQNLHAWLVFSPASITPETSRSPMEVSVPFRSKYDKSALELQYRFIFLDAQGRPLKNNPGFAFLHVEPRLQYFLEGNALDTGVADWRLEIRAAR